MNEIEALEDFFQGKIDAETSIKILENNSKEAKSKLSPLIRTIECFSTGKIYDGLGHLRQSILYFHKPIHINGLWLERCKKYADIFDFFIDLELHTVDVKPWAMEDNKDLRFEYEFSLKRMPANSIGDSALKNFFGFDTYISLQQKMMMHSLKKMEKGEVLLACIPTGSGKSLLWQYAVATGKFKGITVVVIPTNALSSDHIQSDRRVFATMPWIKSVAYSADQNMHDERYMESICNEIRSGKDMILYVSPESLTNFNIKKALLDASAHDYIAAVVVDEVHLLVDWGMHFRPEFQLVPALCKRINSQYPIYTVLLSATITIPDSITIRELFSYGNFCEYRGDELRPEIEFYSHVCNSEETRCNILKQLVPLVPKPAIIYVGTKEQCAKYYHLVKEIGLSRVQAFTGETSDSERERIIKEWRNNSIDVIVATSAFGMGVDKSDVRTIITAYLPENISRFYQEVGRAGRDGYSALNFSLVCFFEDVKVADSFTDSRLLTVDSLLDRWNELKENAKPADESDCIWIDTSNAPTHLKHSIIGGRNSGWNQDVILLMARCGYVEIVDVLRDYSSSYKAYKIKVRIKRFNEIDNAISIEQRVSELRDSERSVIVAGKQAVRDMFSSQNEDCYSFYLSGEFSYTLGGCNGCPACRRNELGKWFLPGSIKYISNREITKQKTYKFANTLSSVVNQVSRGMLFFETDLSEDMRTDLSVRLLIAGAEFLVFSRMPGRIIESLRKIENSENVVVTYDEYERIPNEMVSGTVVFFMDGTDEENKRMLAKSNEHAGNGESINVIYICQRDYYYNEEQHFLRDCLEYSLPISVVLKEEIIC